MRIVFSTALNLAFAAAGFRSNGGCTCGCGVECGRWYERWSCPADAGFACSADMSASNPPFFGDPNRPAPCTAQPAAVEAWL